MKNQDIEFLKELQHQMLTQDKVGQVNPRFWVVRQKVRTYGIDEDFDFDGTEVIHDGERLADNFKELYEYLRDNEEDLEIEYYEDIIEESVTINKDTDEEQCFDNIGELVDYIRQELDYNDALYLVNYKEEYVIAEDTMFLTIEECRKHINCNGYHYNEPHPYAMTAWRSPQVKRLYEILENTNWDEFIK